MSTSPSQDAPRRLRCRLGLHRWVRIKHVDADLADPEEDAVWTTTCRYCGAERGSGVAATAVLSGLLAVAGALIWWLLSPVLGVLLLFGAVMGAGWAARIAALGRAARMGFRYRG